MVMGAQNQTSLFLVDDYEGLKRIFLRMNYHGKQEKIFYFNKKALDFEKNFEKLLDICEEHDILVEVDEEINKVIQKQIEETKQKINKAKSTYSWKLYECEDNKNCKKDIVKRFLKHLFNYSPIII